jgi:hypothetical protein
VVISYQLLVIGYWLSVIGYRLLGIVSGLFFDEPVFAGILYV